MDNKHGGKKSQRTRFCTWKLTERKKSLQCHVSLLSNERRRRQFIFVFLHLIPETSRPGGGGGGGGCSDKCLEFFWPVLHWQANKLQNNFIWMPKKSCVSRLLPQEYVQHFFSIHQTHKGLLSFLLLLLLWSLPQPTQNVSLFDFFCTISPTIHSDCNL